jgi:hypothetical protein
MTELNRNLEDQAFDYKQIYLIAKHVGLRTKIAAVLVEYLVSKGYDSDELS